MRRLVIVLVIALLAVAVAARHPVERALGLGGRAVIAPPATRTATPAGKGRAKGGGAASSGGQAATSGRGAGGAATSTRTGTATSGGGATSSTQGAGAGKAGATSGGAVTSGGGAKSTAGASGGAASSGHGAGGAASSGGGATTTAPPVTSYPGASTISAFYAAVSAARLAQAYALLAPSLQSQQSQSAFAQAYAGVRHAAIQSLTFQSAGNFSRTFDVTVVIATATGTQTVSGAITVQDQSGGVGAPDYAISALGVAP